MPSFRIFARAYTPAFMRCVLLFSCDIDCAHTRLSQNPILIRYFFPLCILPLLRSLSTQCFIASLWLKSWVVDAWSLSFVAHIFVHSIAPSIVLFVQGLFVQEKSFISPNCPKRQDSNLEQGY